jgi:hypothetical protein
MTYPGPAESHIELNQGFGYHEIPEITHPEVKGATLEMKLGEPEI